MQLTMKMKAWSGSGIPTLLVASLLVVTLGCSPQMAPTLICNDIRETQNSPWILRIDEADRTAEMIVDVPVDSVRNGVPPGNRSGVLRVSERTYEIVIPADSGGQGEQAWARMRFSFEIDRFTRTGTLQIGEERYGEVPEFQIHCEAGPQSPIL